MSRSVTELPAALGPDRGLPVDALQHRNGVLVDQPERPTFPATEPAEKSSANQLTSSATGFSCTFQGHQLEVDFRLDVEHILGDVVLVRMEVQPGAERAWSLH